MKGPLFVGRLGGGGGALVGVGGGGGHYLGWGGGGGQLHTSLEQEV